MLYKPPEPATWLTACASKRSPKQLASKAPKAKEHTSIAQPARDGVDGEGERNCTRAAADGVAPPHKTAGRCPFAELRKGERIKHKRQRRPTSRGRISRRRNRMSQSVNRATQAGALVHGMLRSVRKPIDAGRVMLVVLRCGENATVQELPQMVSHPRTRLRGGALSRS
jgi:hypothetical protein